MKIAVIGTLGVPATYGGVERHVEELYSRLASRGHQITVYCRSHYTKIDRPYKGMSLKRFPSIRTKHLETITHSLLSSLDILHQRNDIVHYHSAGSAPLSFIPKLCGSKSVVTLHGLDWRREKWGKFAKWYLKQGEQAAMYFPTKTIVVSRTMREHYRQVYKKEVIYIPNGVNIPSLYRINKICKFGLKKDGYILFVGRLVPEKGCHFLIQAFKNLQTDLKLVIAGGSRHTDEYAESLKREASDKIVFTGYVYGDVLAELFSNAYFFVQPSTLEGLPISLLEAMSYGRCVIASDIPENLEVIEDSGYPFRNKDINHLQEVMVMLLENPKLVTEAGEKAIQRVAEEYNWAHIADTTERIFLSIV